MRDALFLLTLDTKSITFNRIEKDFGQETLTKKVWNDYLFGQETFTKLSKESKAATTSSFC